MYGTYVHKCTSRLVSRSESIVKVGVHMWHGILKLKLGCMLHVVNSTLFLFWVILQGLFFRFFTYQLF